MCVEQMLGKLLCDDASHSICVCDEAQYACCVKRLDRSHSSVSEDSYFFGTVAQRLVQGTHEVSCAIRMETSYGMVSKSVNSKRTCAHDNAEPSRAHCSEGVET